ncbi:MAG TPA: FkbM family methyltransferase [Xanthobacteraceae bacterium]|jgi:FkbM family methyltransferase
MAPRHKSCKDHPRIPSWREIRAVYERRRRALRQAALEPILVGWPLLRQVVTNALAARGHLVLCDLGDVRFFVDPGDRVVGAWVMWHGGWQRREIDTAVSVLAGAGRLHKDAAFIDVGAHIGTHTIYALRSGRFTRAVAFEPEPRNARLLAMNLEANGLSAAAIVVRKAAGASAGKGVLHLHPRNTGAHAVGSPPSIDGQVALEVPMVRLDEELESLGIAPSQVGLVWIDAEGYEPQVLEGVAGLLPHSIPLAFEFTPSRYSAETRQQLVARLAAHYSMFQSLGLRDAGGPIGALASRARTDDVLVY